MIKEAATKKLKQQENRTAQPSGEKVKKKKKRKSKSVNKPNNEPPSKAEDFSSNWKKFLNNQPKTELKVKNDDIKSKDKGEKNETKSKDNFKNSSRIIAAKDTKNKPNKKRKRSESKSETPTEPNEIWFDVDPELLKKTKRQNKCTNNNTNDEETTPTDDTTEVNGPTSTDAENNANLTRYLALDCEMVGVGIEGKESVLARVSIVNSKCECVYDKFVKSAEKVVDYRTHVSGVRATDLQHATDYGTVQEEVSEMLKGRVVVGHALSNDFKVLMLSHPAKDTRDTGKYKPFRTLLKTKRPALKRLVDEILHQEIQVGEHSSVVDAQMTMRLYKKFKKEWEKSLHCKGGKDVVIQPKEVFMGTSLGEKKKRKVNKWKKIRDRKKKKLRDE